MKLIVITLLISYYFCTKIINLNTFSSFAEEKEGMFNIDISDYDVNDVIHFVVFTVQGEMDKSIYYGFIDNETAVSTTPLPYSESTTFSEQYCTGKKHKKVCGHKYYYDIKKEENKSFLRIKYSGYYGKRIYYEKMGIGAITYIIITGIIILICCIGGFLYLRYKKKKNSTEEIILIPQDSQPLESI